MSYLFKDLVGNNNSIDENEVFDSETVIKHTYILNDFFFTKDEYLMVKNKLERVNQLVPDGIWKPLNISLLMIYIYINIFKIKFYLHNLEVYF